MEFTNAIWMKAFWKEITAAEVRRQLDLFEFDPVPHQLHLVVDASADMDKAAGRIEAGEISGAIHPILKMRAKGIANKRR